VVRRAIRPLFSTLFNQCLGAFFLFVASLTIGSILLRVAYFTNVNDRHILTGFLETEIEPQSDVARGAVLSIVLQAARKPEVSEGLACSGASIGDCAVAKTIKERTEALVELLNPQTDDRDAPPKSRRQPTHDANPRTISNQRTPGNTCKPKQSR
jgi:hypothetical protein